MLFRAASGAAHRTTVTKTGVHRLKVWMVDPTVVPQRLLTGTGGLPALHLGPPESRWL
ncbi:hypothetical protein ABZ079_20080 [Streptomyces sp. NPDC006314]|uniref:hypothetical protein n=1 Tax=Streptomyces sp. NPDC006314 TaxID=3154475 RepID=UPI0033A5420E